MIVGVGVWVVTVVGGVSVVTFLGVWVVGGVDEVGAEKGTKNPCHFVPPKSSSNKSNHIPNSCSIV